MYSSGVKVMAGVSNEGGEEAYCGINCLLCSFVVSDDHCIVVYSIVSPHSKTPEVAGAIKPCLASDVGTGGGHMLFTYSGTKHKISCVVCAWSSGCKASMAPSEAEWVVGATIVEAGTGSKKKLPWLSDVDSGSAPLHAAMAAAKQALPSCKLDSDRVPTPDDIHLPLSAKQLEALADGTPHLAGWRERVGVSRFVQARGLADQEARLKQFVVTGHHCTAFMFPHVVSARAFDALGCVTSTLFMADDLCFDEDVPAFRPGDVHRGDRAKARAFILAWCRALRADSPDPPPGGSDVARLLAWTWSSGRELRRVSSPECVDAVMDYFDAYADACLEVQEDVGGRYARDVLSHCLTRAYYGAVMAYCVMAEIAVQEFLPPHVRAHPVIQKLAFAVNLHVCFVNDIYSYDREVAAAARSGSPLYNILAVLMGDEEGLKPLQALRRAVEMVNAYCRVILQAEAELPLTWGSPAVDSAVRRHVLALKEIAAGHLYFCERGLPERFAWPDLSPPSPTVLVRPA